MDESVIEYEEDNDHSMSVEILFQCGSCFIVFPNKNLLLDHLKTHSLALTHQCQYCDRNFATITEKEKHNCIKRFTCQYCGDILESLLKKTKHEQEHHDQKFGHSCDVCGKKFAHETTLDQNYNLHHSLLLKEHACQQCPRKFKHKTKLDFHVRSTHGPRQTPYLCCNLTFKNLKEFKRHKIQKHPAINDKRNCNVCAKLIPCHSMKKHLQEHEKGSNKVPFSCKECDGLFATEKFLKSHVRKSHQPQKCLRCDFVYTSHYLFKKHKMMVHDCMKGVFTCECSKTFMTRKDLARHSSVHHEERWHQCYVCDKKFKSRHDLKQHERSHQEGGHLYKCESCFQCFSQMSSKIRHQNTHSNEKRYSCSLCGTKFKYAYNKTRHEKTHQNLGGPGFRRPRIPEKLCENTSDEDLHESD